MDNKYIEFPKYFELNTKFKKLSIDDQVFVDYKHQLDTINDIKLSIEQTFLLFVVKGTVNLLSTDQTWHIRSTQMALVRKGSYIMSEDLSDDGDQFKAFLFFLSDDLIEDFFMKSDKSRPLDSQNRFYVCPIQVTSALHLYIQSIILLLDNEEEVVQDQNLLRIKAKELLHLLIHVKESDQVLSVLSHSADNEESRLKQLVEKNFFNKISIEEMAFLCHMSVSNFKRKFNKYYGTSPGKWIKERKLEHSLKILTNTEKTVLEVSLEAGYKSTSHYIKEFKSKFGISPAKARIESKDS